MNLFLFINEIILFTCLDFGFAVKIYNLCCFADSDIDVSNFPLGTFISSSLFVSSIKVFTENCSLYVHWKTVNMIG